MFTAGRVQSHLSQGVFGGSGKGPLISTGDVLTSAPPAVEMTVLATSYVRYASLFLL